MKKSSLTKIAFLVDYYSPFTPGGSEWSVYYLAEQLKQNKIESIIITPNYGAKNEEVIDGIKVIRFPIFKKPKDNRSVINPIWQNNPLFFLWSAFWIVKICLENRISLIHVNGKFTIPGAWIATRVLKKPLIVTLRDKQLLCSYGRCFFDDGRYKACGFFEYLYRDLLWYFKNYVGKKNINSFLYTVFSGIYTRVAYSLIKFFSTRADKIVAISIAQKKYLEANGYKNVLVIYNSVLFKDLKKSAKTETVLYAGKLSLGKGIYLLLNAIPQVLAKYNVQFLMAGGIDEKDKINKVIKKLKIEKNVKLLGGVDHHKLQNLYQTAKLVVMPSIYPEAFGRVALESLANGTPVVVVDKGGLPEIIDDKKTGRVVGLNEKELANGIIDVLNNSKRYQQNIAKQYQVLKKKFETDPIKQYLALYRKLI